MTKPYVIDAEGHVLEAQVDWAARLPPAYRDQAPQIVMVNGRNRCLIEGRIRAWAQGPGPGNTGPFSEDLDGTRPSRRMTVQGGMRLASPLSRGDAISRWPAGLRGRGCMRARCARCSCS